MKTIRVLLVDDNEMFLASIKRFLSSVVNVEVVGTALSGEEALRYSANLSPDLVLMDLTLPAMNGLDATRLIKKSANPPRVITLTVHDNAEYRRAARLAGADGFVAKSEFGEKLQPLIESLFVQRA